MGATSLVRFSHIAAGNSFTTTEIHPAVIEALGCAPGVEVSATGDSKVSLFILVRKTHSFHVHASENLKLFIKFAAVCLRLWSFAPRENRLAVF